MILKNTHVRKVFDINNECPANYNITKMED